MLALCSAGKHEAEAALALARWEELQEVPRHERRERRFRHRAFERARDRALQALAMRLKPWMLNRSGSGSAGRRRRSRSRGRPLGGTRMFEGRRG